MGREAGVNSSLVVIPVWRIRPGAGAVNGGLFDSESKLRYPAFFA